MTLSLSGERSVAAGSHAHPLRALITWFAQANAARARRTALQSLMSMDDAQLRDIGLSHADIIEAMSASRGRTSGMVLNAARARSARS